MTRTGRREKQVRPTARLLPHSSFGTSDCRLIDKHWPTLRYYPPSMSVRQICVKLCSASGYSEMLRGFLDFTPKLLFRTLHRYNVGPPVVVHRSLYAVTWRGQSLASTRPRHSLPAYR